MLDFGRVSETLSVEVTGIALQDCTDQDLAAILRRVERCPLVVFRRQSLDDRDLYDLARRIGPLEESSRKVCLSPDYPAVSYLSNLCDEAGDPIGFAGNTTDFWHSDQQHRERPATLGILYCVVPAPIGGATSFVATNVDLAGLDSESVTELAQRRALYEPAYNHDNAPSVRVSHPALLVSPSSGRRFAYISDNTIAFTGLNSAESLALKTGVLECLTRPGAIYSHQWRTGDLILYDNVQLLHRREEFRGRRWLKGVKIYAPPSIFAVPHGLVEASGQP